MILYQLAKWAEQNTRKQQQQVASSPNASLEPVDFKAIEEAEWYDVQTLRDTKLWMNGTLEHWILPQEDDALMPHNE